MRKFLFAALLLAAACKQNKSKLDDMTATKVSAGYISGGSVMPSTQVSPSTRTHSCSLE